MLTNKIKCLILFAINLANKKNMVKMNAYLTYR